MDSSDASKKVWLNTMRLITELLLSKSSSVEKVTRIVHDFMVPLQAAFQRFSLQGLTQEETLNRVESDVNTVNEASTSLTYLNCLLLATLISSNSTTLLL